MLRVGRVRRNGQKAKPDDVLEAGDTIRIFMAEDDFANVRRNERKFAGVPTDLDIVYEDEHMLIVNKPAGLLTHGAPGEYKDTLVNRVWAYLYRTGGLEERVFMPAPVHRLDRNTSGLVIFGKSAAATQRLTAAIEARRIRKWYLAIVKGHPPSPGEFTSELVRDPHSNRTRVDPAGRTAVTRYEVQVACGKTSVVKVELVSGRTHQIRAHFQNAGYPLWGDVKYGGPLDRGAAGPSHQWLHAAWLEMEDGQRFFAPLPANFVAALRRLGYTSEMIARAQAF